MVMQLLKFLERGTLTAWRKTKSMREKMVFFDLERIKYQPLVLRRYGQTDT